MITTLIPLFFLAFLALSKDCIPEQIHIAFGDSDTQLRISWATKDHCHEHTVTVWSSSSTNRTLTPITLSYDPLGYWHHHAQYSGVRSDVTRYYYRFEALPNQTYTFNLRRNPESINVLVFGDAGIETDTFPEYTYPAMLQHYQQADFLYHVGDLGYADVHKDSKFEKHWNEYMNWMARMASSKPYMVLPGNHERKTVSNPLAENFSPFNTRFCMPGCTSPRKNMWYSFTYGPVRFIQFSTESDYPNHPSTSASFGNQIQWLESELSSVDRSVTPFVIVSGHRPLYDPQAGKFDPSTGLPATGTQEYYTALAFEPLFLKYKVDLYISGHLHNYLRSTPIRNGKVVTQSEGPIYIIQGNAGCHSKHSQDAPQAPVWAAYENTVDYGYAFLQANSTTLVYEGYTSPNTILDDRVVIKSKFNK